MCAVWVENENSGKEIQRKDQRNSRNRGVECHVIQGKRERQGKNVQLDEMLQRKRVV